MTKTSLWERTIEQPDKSARLAADFPGRCRLHMSLNVTNLKQAVEFYRVFFGADPIKVRAGYAKFDISDPPLNLSLNEFPDDIGVIGHFGIQVKNTSIVREAFERFRTSGFKLVEEDGVACCYAVQSKLWVVDPDGYRWEMFVTIEPEAEEGCGPDCICHAEIERSYAGIATSASAR